ncbi:MAG: hypothetical protein C4305_00440 [Thermoleophilia bacterium]
MERIGEDVERELSRLGPKARMGEIVSAWPQVVGEAIARNAWPARLRRDGTLQVHTSSAAWAFELAQLAPRIASSLRLALGERAPKALRFAPGPLPETAPGEAGRSAPCPSSPSPQAVERARLLVVNMGESELACAIARAAALSLAKTESSHAL